MKNATEDLQNELELVPFTNLCLYAYLSAPLFFVSFPSSCCLSSMAGGCLQARQQQAQLVLQKEELQSEVNRTEHMNKGSTKDSTKSKAQLDDIVNEATQLRLQLVQTQNELSQVKEDMGSFQKQKAATAFAAASQKIKMKKQVQSEAKGSEHLQTLLDNTQAEVQSLNETIAADADKMEKYKAEIQKLKDSPIVVEVPVVDTVEVERLTSELAQVNALLEEGSNAVQEFEDELLGQAQQAVQDEGKTRVKEITSACEVERQKMNDELADAQKSLKKALEQDSAKAKGKKAAEEKLEKAEAINDWLGEQVAVLHLLLDWQPAHSNNIHSYGCIVTLSA